MQALYYNRWWPIVVTWSHNENGHKPRILRLVQWFVLYSIALWMMMEWGWHLSEFHCLTQEQGDKWLDTWVKAVQEANVHSPDKGWILIVVSSTLPAIYDFLHCGIEYIFGSCVLRYQLCHSTDHHGQLIKWTLIARVFVDLFRGLKGLFSLVHVWLSDNSVHSVA